MGKLHPYPHPIMIKKQDMNTGRFTLHLTTLFQLYAFLTEHNTIKAYSLPRH